MAIITHLISYGVMFFASHVTSEIFTYIKEPWPQHVRTLDFHVSLNIYNIFELEERPPFSVDTLGLFTLGTFPYVLSHRPQYCS